MAKVTINRPDKTYKILATGKVAVASDYFHLVGLPSGLQVTFQASIASAPDLVKLENDEGRQLTESEQQLVSQYVWSKAPPWAHYAAINADGSASWYEAEPELDEGSGKWRCRYLERRNWPMYSVVRSYPDWRNSLCKRPVEPSTGSTEGASAPAPAPAPAVPLSATVVVEVSNDSVTWTTLGTIALTATQNTGILASQSSWPYVRAKTTAVAGENAFVIVTLGV